MNWVTGYQKWLTESESLNNAQLVANFFQNSGWTRETISAYAEICDMNLLLILI